MNVSALSASPSKPTRIFNATFARAPRHHAIDLTVLAENLHVGGTPLLARVGNQAVTNLVPIGGGYGFTGTLAQTPHEGDRLYLLYIGALEVPTDITYHAGGGRENVA